MDIRTEQLTDRHYRSVRSIYRNTFDREKFSLNDINTSWHYRSKPDSIGLFDGATLIGFLIASYHARNGTNMYIDYIALDEAYRGKGLGSTLLNMVLIPGRSVHLCPERPELHDWYRRQGFRETYDGYFNRHYYGTRSNL